MTLPRKEIVDPSVTRFYHCISRCVRQAALLADDKGRIRTDRKEWIQSRLKFLNDIFAISVSNFAILDNHLHCVLRLDGEVADNWSSQEVVRRWYRLFPPNRRKVAVFGSLDQFIAVQSQDLERVNELRGRLKDLGWFMKSLKEPLSRLCNMEDGCKGAFFDARYKSIGIIDNESLIAVCAYVDLNVFAAGMADTPENSPHTSLKERVSHLREHVTRACMNGVQISDPSDLDVDLEQDHWLIPIEDRRGTGAGREGLFQGLSVMNYLKLIDEAARKPRANKVNLSLEVAGIIERLGFSSEQFERRLVHLSSHRIHGCYMSRDPESLQSIARAKGRHHFVNVFT